jgi:hypothetical protein
MTENEEAVDMTQQYQSRTLNNQTNSSKKTNHLTNRRFGSPAIYYPEHLNFETI